MIRVFRDRHDAGAQLARALHRYADAADVIVLAHTSSSVAVGYEVATRLGLPLDMLDLELEPSIDVADTIVVLVDDGDAARTMPIAIERLRARGAASVVAAVAVASPQVYAQLHAAADHATCVLTPQHIYSIEAWYADLSEPSGDDLQALLVAATQSRLLVRRGNLLSTDVDT